MDSRNESSSRYAFFISNKSLRLITVIFYIGFLMPRNNSAVSDVTQSAGDPYGRTSTRGIAFFTTTTSQVFYNDKNNISAELLLGNRLSSLMPICNWLPQVLWMCKRKPSAFLNVSVNHLQWSGTEPKFRPFEIELLIYSNLLIRFLNYELVIEIGTKEKCQRYYATEEATAFQFRHLFDSNGLDFATDPGLKTLPLSAKRPAYGYTSSNLHPRVAPTTCT
uniref:Uncharacterized protein n=1 Tax=Glossina brevipalpis TaxID=37001 RepID=A0A1A9WZ37_9MUSC